MSSLRKIRTLARPRYILSILGLLLALFLSALAQPPLSGSEALKLGKQLFAEKRYEEAATALWTAVLMHSSTPPAEQYDVQEVFQQFMQCYMIEDRLVDGLVFVADQSFRRNQRSMGENYLQQALSIDPKHDGALALQEEFMGVVRETTNEDDSQEPDMNPDLTDKTPEELYEVASASFSRKAYEECADVFEISCVRSKYQLGPSCVNAVYCRTAVDDWGFNGTGFASDMRRVDNVTRQEVKQHRFGMEDRFVWQRATSVHPHMMLAYPLDPMLKRYSAEAVSYMDEKMARVKGSGTAEIQPLPEGLPFAPGADRERFTAGDKIRVGFVGSGFNSKAVLYLSQDMFRFFDRDRFEIHVFSFGPADSPQFIDRGMHGVDWRKRVQANVDHFHDCQRFVDDHIAGARYIHEHAIGILIEWDGFARQGERAQGLMALRPAPVQILHQEYLGTSGAQYVDYIFSDQVVSPPKLQNLYVEKIIYMPNHFFSKGHAYQKEVKKPTLDYLPAKRPYEPGTGSPVENKCMAPAGTKAPKFVFCNYNKLLKGNPETVRSWIRILREVPDSMLCLLENPKEGVAYFRRFVHEAAGTSKNHSDPESFEPGDGDELNSRIHFLTWERSPFKHQMRNQDFCHVMLDSHPYNGHTVAQDALYGGVPIVTRSDGDDMSSRVTTSANLVLGLEDLNAYHGPSQYEDVAIRLGTDLDFYQSLRTKLIETALQRNPMHPYWDVARYVKNFEVGLTTAWNLYLNGQPPEHIFIQETVEAAKGTYDDEIAAHPQDGPLSVESHDEL